MIATITQANRQSLVNAGRRGAPRVASFAAAETRPAAAAPSRRSSFVSVLLRALSAFAA